MSAWMRAAAALCAGPLAGGLAAPADAAQPRRLQPHTLLIQVVPAMAGVAFTLDGRRFVSDAGGLASTTVLGAGTRRLSVRVPAARPGMRYAFERWSGGGSDEFGATRDVALGGRVTRLVAGFGTACLVGWRFTDDQGEPIPNRTVQGVMLKDDAGGLYRLAAEGSQWLPARRVVRENSGKVSARQLDYTVESVTVEGANAVFRSQQRFRPTPNATQTIRLRFHQMLVSVHDAAFGFPVGSAVQVRSPDGRVRRLELDGRATARSGRLARGDYQLKALGPGVGWWTPVRLSRSQEVRLVLVSWLDLAAVTFVLVLVLVGLPLVGRLLGRRSRALATGAGP
ncbi:MAG TPA: hypothetical protein VF486_25610 [Actinomycetes bacterium]